MLGLLVERPRTGYEVLKVIAVSPSFGVRATAGSVYPALRRLARLGQIRAEDASAGARSASRYHLTPAGESAFDAWLRDPVPFGTAAATEDLLLRVLFSNRMPEPHLRALLSAHQAAMSAQVATLEASAPAWAKLPVQQRLCLENGLRSARTQLEWAGWALEELPGRRRSAGESAVSQDEGGEF